MICTRCYRAQRQLGRPLTAALAYAWASAHRPFDLHRLRHRGDIRAALARCTERARP